MIMLSTAAEHEVAPEADVHEAHRPPPVSPRKRFVAAFLSAMLPGFGQLYNGQINRAIWIFLCFGGIAIPGIASAALYLPVSTTTIALGLGVLVAIAIWIFSIIDAWRVAAKLTHYRLKPWQTSGMYVVSFVICNLILLPLFVGYVRQHQIQAFKIPSDSMTPTVLRGDYLFADMRYNCPTCKIEFERGDVAIFVYPNNRNRLYIKRIIGLPGDEVRIEKGHVFVNGSPLSNTEELEKDSTSRIETYGERSWRVSRAPESESEPHTLRIPQGQVLVLGDNRANTKDSRHFGTVPLSDVVGRARQVWFSLSDEGVRWDRLGVDVQRGVFSVDD
ncbi:MAG: signal peptidase I [Pseudomonadales bacterium]